VENRQTFLSVVSNANIPSFVQKDHVNFVKFINYYYQWLDNNTFQDLQNLFLNQDINDASDEMVDYYYDIFAEGFPKTIIVDKRYFLKQIHSLYTSKGTEASFEFFFKAVYGVDINFYYPKVDILRASDGKYELLKSIRAEYSEELLNATGKNIRGTVSRATALIESTVSYFIGQYRIVELFLGNIEGVFVSSDEIEIIGEMNSFHIYQILQSVSITDPGTGYSVGEFIPVLNRSSAITFDSSLKHFDGTSWKFDSSGETFSGLDATARVKSIFKGSIESISILNSGDFYRVGENVIFQNITVANTAYAKIKQVTKLFETNQLTWDSSQYSFDSTSGKILDIEILGKGFNYNEIPSLTIDSLNGVNGVLKANSSTIGGIKELEITSFGLNYTSPPIINFAVAGDRNASGNAITNVLALWQGRWRNNDGFLNDKKFLIDDFYYQDFSYVLKTQIPIEDYLNIVKQILHPTGFQLFAELLINNDVNLYNENYISLILETYILNLPINIGLYLSLEEILIAPAEDNQPSLNMTYELFDEYKYLFKKANQGYILNYYALTTESFETTLKYESVDFVPDVEITNV
jgi:hypothetical protein